MHVPVFDRPASIPDGVPSASSRRRRRERSVTVVHEQILATGLLSAAVVGSMLGIGAVHLPVLLVSAALSFGAAAVALRRQALGRDGIVLPVPALACAALAVYSLLQSIPLPMRVLETLAPAVADVWQRSLMPFGEHGPAWASLSLDPGASRVEALRWVTYAAVFVASSAVAASHGAEWGLRLVFASALAAALVTMGHGLVGASKVYGVYTPLVERLAWHVAPLLNPNNLAGYLNLGALTGLGLMLGNRPGAPRWLIGVGVALLVGVLVTTASRGGVASLVLGVALLGVLARQRGDERADNAASNLMLLGALACGVAFAILGGTQKIWEELYDKDLSKLGMFLWGKPMVRDNPVFGVGRGAFESVFPMYRGLAGAGVYSHAENFVVQWIVEWGLPVGLAAMGLFAWTFAPKRLGALRSKTIAGAWCAAFALSAQNLLDLAFEVPAVMIALAALLGSIWGDRARPKHGDAIRLSGPFTRPRAALVAAGVACAGLLFGAVALASGRHDDDLDRRDAYEVAEASKADPAPVRSALHAAMSRHPAEPFFPLLGATVAFRAHDQSPIPWIQRSLERALVNGRAHLLLAQVLQQRGAHKQALLEMRLAAEDDKGLMGYLGPLAVGYARSFEELLATVPENETGGLFLSSYAALLRRADARPAEAELGRRCDLEAIRRDPTLLDPRIREAEARIAALSASKDVKDAKDAKDVGGSGIAICADAASCRQEVLEQANAIARLSPASALPAILEAHLLIAEGKPEEAAKSLESACAAVKPADRAGCLQVRVTAAAKVKAPALLDAASKELLGAACVTPQSCANTATLLASLRMSRGENGAGLALLARATREDPSDDGRWIALADAASAAGAHAEALNALEHVARRRGNDYGPIAARLAAERALVSNRMYLKQ